MSRENATSQSPLAIVSGIAGMLFGVIVGYIIGQQQARGAVGALASPAGQVAQAAASGPTSQLADERVLQAYRDILARDPKNAKAATDLANLLYDAGRFAEAVPYYQQAFALDPRNIDLSTDLGTTLWYTGRADEALAQYAKSLAIDPRHPETLFNIGIVRRDGQQDLQGAIDVWERLLVANPGSAEAGKVQALLQEARQKRKAVS